MKILNDEDDRHQCIAIKHEYLKCHDAFKQFAMIAENLIINGHQKQDAYRAYNYYSYFIQHLYELIMACHARDLQDTSLTNLKGQEKNIFLDTLLMVEADRVVNNRISDIKLGIAPKWENDISAYENILPIPESFGKDFRRYRNKISAHASLERIKRMNLTQFYLKYHPYLYLMYTSIGNFWGREYQDFPDLSDITNFFAEITKKQNKL